MQKQSKRLLAVILALCMMMTLLPMTAFAEEDVLKSSDTYTDVSLADAKAYLSGSGTEADPFQIWTADDLYYINYIEYWHWKDNDPSESSDVYYYQQKADLDLSKADADKFDKPYGYITANFGGVYDGGGHTISGMDKPLFYFTKGAYVGDEAGEVFSEYSDHEAVFSAIVRNLTIEAPAIDQAVATDVIEQIAAVAAYAVNATFYNINVSGGRVSGISGAAAIVGRGGSVVIDSCSSDAAISASLYRAAGIVSNLRITDEKKGATAHSLVTGCSFSGTISGALDGARGTAGIVGGAYIDGDSTLETQLPLYVTDCTFSGEINVTVTGGTGGVGGILGTSFLRSGLLELSGNKVTGTIQAKSSGGIAYVGGLIGLINGNSSTDLGGTGKISGNTIGATLPKSDYSGSVYVGQQIGSIRDVTWALESPSISNESTTGDYGNLQTVTLTGQVGDLVIPGVGETVTLYIDKDCTVGSIQVSSGALGIYNEGKAGDVEAAGNITIYANEGEIGDVKTEGGYIYVGAGNKSEDNANGIIGNEGTLGDLTASGVVTIYRNAKNATIGDVKSETGAVTIGQNDLAYRDYNTNNGAIGSVTAAGKVDIAGTGSGTVAIEEGETVKAGTTVSIGSSATYNNNTVGAVEAGTSVSIYGGESSRVTSVDAGTSVAIGSSTVQNLGTVGAVTAGTTVGIYGGENSSVATGSGETVQAGGNITIGTTAVPNKANVGDISTPGAVTVYSAASAEIGDITRTGETAANVTIGSAAAPNGADVGKITNVNGGVTGYTTGTVGEINAKTNNLLIVDDKGGE